MSYGGPDPFAQAASPTRRPAGPATLLFALEEGFLVWVGVRSRVLLLSEKRLSRRVLAQVLADRSTEAESAVLARVRITPNGGKRLPSVRALLRAVGASNASELKVFCDCDAEGIAHLVEWRRALAHHLDRSAAKLTASLEVLVSGQRELTCLSPAGAADARVPVCARIPVGAGSRRAQRALLCQADNAARAGIRIHPQLSLGCQGAGSWITTAREWLDVSRGEGVDFAPPLLARNAARSPELPLVRNLLVTAYESARYDLRKCAPFADWLEALLPGRAILAYEARHANDGRLRLRRIDPSARPLICCCEFGPICSAVAVSGLRPLYPTGSVLKQRCRFYCDALRDLLPRMARDIAQSMRHNAELRGRPADRRFRVAVHHGNSAVALERVRIRSELSNAIEPQQENQAREGASGARA